MPKSKRNKVVALTKTKEKGQQLKSDVVKELREALEQYSHVYVFTVESMRNNKLKELRAEWRHSRFFMGKNKIMAVALGTSVETELQPDLHLLAEKLVGDVGLLFTDRTPEEVRGLFEQHTDTDFARSGTVASDDFVLEEGPLEQFPHNMETQLRQLGLPTTLKKSVVTLDKDYVVCKAGQTLTPEQCKILKLFGVQMAVFKPKLLAYWTDGKFTDLEEGEDEDQE